MKNPLDKLDFMSKKNDFDELEKLAGIVPPNKSTSFASKIADQIGVKKSENTVSNKSASLEDNYWEIHKTFALANEKYGRPFALFVGDFLDIILSGPVQAKLVNEMIEEKIIKMKKAQAADKEPDTRKVSVASKRNPKYDVKIGGKDRIFPKHFLKRKNFLASLFLDSDEYSSFLKLIKQIELVCEEENSEQIPETKNARQEGLNKIIGELKYEIKRDDLISAWSLLQADTFEKLEWIYNETKIFHLVRPNFYEDLDKAYRVAKSLLKLVRAELKDDFPPQLEKQDALIDYLDDILDVYTHHHFVVKFFNQTRPTVTLKDFEMTKEELQDKISELRDDNIALRENVQQITVDRDKEGAQARAANNKNEELVIKLKQLDPNVVQKQIQGFEAKINACNKEIEAYAESESEQTTALRELDLENQKLTKKLQELHAIPDESAYCVEGLLTGKRVVIFGGIGRDHYLSILTEAGVKDDDYEWREGYHTISAARTAEIVGRCDLIVIFTSYAGHLLLYQVRPCIKDHQHFFKIHNSGAGSLRKEILQTFKKN